MTPQQKKPMPQSHFRNNREPAQNLARAHQTYGEMKRRDALQGYVPGAEEGLHDIIEVAKDHEDWELYFDAQSDLVHILSVENSTGPMRFQAERGLEQAKALGDTNWQQRFQVEIDDARKRDSETLKFWRCALLVLALLVIVITGFIIWLVARIFLFPQP